MVVVRVMIFLLIGLLVSTLFSYSVDYNNYLSGWFKEDMNILGSDPASRLIFYLLKVTNLPIETFIILPYCMLSYFVRKNHFHLMMTILLSYSVMFNSLITVRTFSAVMFFMIPIFFSFKSNKVSFKYLTISFILGLVSISFHLSLVLFLPIYLVALINWTRTTFVLVSIFSLILVIIFFSINGQSLLQPYYFRLEYALYGQQTFSLAQIGHLILLILEFQLLRIHLYKKNKKLILMLLAYGLIIFVISLIFHSLIISRIMHIYHLISLILIMRYTLGNSLLIKIYLAIQIFMSFYMLNLSQTYFPGINDGSLILIFSTVMFCYIFLHELALQLERAKK